MLAHKQTDSAPELDPQQWVARHGAVLFRYALVRLKSPERAENVVQETLLAALESLPSYAGRSTERTWLMGILKHKIIDTYRKAARETPLDDSDQAAATETDLFDDRGRWCGRGRGLLRQVRRDVVCARDRRRCVCGLLGCGCLGGTVMVLILNSQFLILNFRTLAFGSGPGFWMQSVRRGHDRWVT